MAKDKKKKPESARAARAKNIPAPDVMQKRMGKFLASDGDRLVSKSKLKAMAKAVDPKIRMDNRVHAAAIKEVAKMVLKAMRRTYDNKRGTIRPSDL